MKVLKRYVSGARKFFNPTNLKIDMMFGGQPYEAEAFEEFVVEDPRMAKHFKKKYKEFGLIDVTYDEAAQKSFKTEKEFYNAQCMKGLEALRARAQLILAREQQAVNESALKNGSSVDNMFFKVKEFKDNLSDVESAIEKMRVKITKDSKADKSKKSEGIESNESGANKDSVEVQA